MKILVAEDDRVSRARLQGLLTKWGHDVQAVEDGEEAWEILARPHSPGLVILDWAMPRMDGLEVVQRVRGRSVPLSIYIILLTGHDSRDETIRALEAGADEYIVKPFDPRELRARVRVGERVLQLQEALSRRVDDLETALKARKQAEEALLQERHLLDALMNNLPDAIYFKDAESRFTRVNLGQARWLGMSDPEAVAGKTDFDFFGGEHAQAARADELEIIRTGKPIINKEEKEVRLDGRESWVSTTKMPFRAPDGQLIGTFGISRDITAHKEAEEGLRTSEERVRLLLDSTAEGIYGVDISGKCTMCNPASLRLLGCTKPEEFLGKSMHALIHYRHPNGSPYPAEQCGINRTIQYGESTHCDTEVFWRADGSAFPAEYWSHPIKRGCQAVGAVVTFFDITERRHNEELLRRSQERSHLLFTTIPRPVWVYDMETLEFLEVNDAALAHYGYSRNEFLRMKISEIWPSDDTPRVVEDVRKRRPPEPSSGQWRHVLKDGQTIDVEISSHVIDFEGRKAVLVVAQDITEQKRLEVELRHSQRLEAVGSLAAGIAHELNTPIQFVGDNVRFLKDGFKALGSLVEAYQGFRDAAAAAGTVDPKSLEAVRKGEEAADLEYLTEEIPKSISQSLDGVDRVATIVRAMKDFAHPDRSEMIAADLNKALESTLTVARNELKYVADVETDFGELPLVPCHLGDLNQVFLNLLVNAAHAIGDAVRNTGAKGRIRVISRQDGAFVSVAIEDTGCGIPVEIREKIFDPFFTTKEVGRGSGQGLAIARSIIVEKHGGTLTFESEVGRGSRFVVRLPLESVVAAQDASRT